MKHGDPELQPWHRRWPLWRVCPWVLREGDWLSQRLLRVRLSPQPTCQVSPHRCTRTPVPWSWGCFRSRLWVPGSWCGLCRLIPCVLRKADFKRMCSLVQHLKRIFPKAKYLCWDWGIRRNPWNKVLSGFVFWRRILASSLYIQRTWRWVVINLMNIDTKNSIPV